MIYFNNKIEELEKIASPFVSLAMLVSITGYFLLMTCFMPYCGLFVK